MPRAKPSFTAPDNRSEVRRDRFENELYEHAARLFAEKGFAATTLQEIGAAMGVSRPALYHYVKSKDELLARVVRQLTELSPALFDQMVQDKTRRPDEKLREAVRMTVTMIAERPSRFRLLTLSESSMSAGLAQEWAEAQRRVRRDLIAIIEEGQRSGVFRAGDARVAAFAVVGMWNWVSWWFKGDPTSAADVADQMADIAVQGLLGPLGTAQQDGPSGVLALLRGNLATLELMITSGDPGANGEGRGTN